MATCKCLVDVSHSPDGKYVNAVEREPDAGTRYSLRIPGGGHVNDGVYLVEGRYSQQPSRSGHQDVLTVSKMDLAEVTVSLVGAKSAK